MGTAAKFIRLDRRDRALALAAARTLAVTWLGLHTAGFTAVERRASRVVAHDPRPYVWCGPPPRSSVAPPTVDRIAWAIRAASRFIPGASNCLVRALATQTLLGRFGYRSQLRLGVRKPEDGSFAAHAWLECAGAIVIGEFEPDQYVLLAPTVRTGRVLLPDSND
jgi:Transglutaminase-like superfamily